MRTVSYIHLTDLRILHLGLLVELLFHQALIYFYRYISRMLMKKFTYKSVISYVESTIRRWTLLVIAAVAIINWEESSDTGLAKKNRNWPNNIPC